MKKRKLGKNKVLQNTMKREWEILLSLKINGRKAGSSSSYKKSSRMIACWNE